MIRILRSLFSKTSATTVPVEPVLSEGEQKAFELGQSVGRQQSEDIERYITWRYDQIRGGYLEVLQNQIDSGRRQDEYPPLTVARVEYSLFLDHANEAEASLRDETKSHFSEWEDVNRQIGIEDILDQLIDKLLSDNFTALKLEGLKVLTDNADILKTADDNWRRKFPEKSAEYPVEE